MASAAPLGWQSQLPGPAALPSPCLFAGLLQLCGSLTDLERVWCFGAAAEFVQLASVGRC